MPKPPPPPPSSLYVFYIIAFLTYYYIVMHIFSDQVQSLPETQWSRTKTNSYLNQKLQSPTLTMTC